MTACETVSDLIPGRSYMLGGFGDKDFIYVDAFPRYHYARRGTDGREEPLSVLRDDAYLVDEGTLQHVFVHIKNAVPEDIHQIYCMPPQDSRKIICTCRSEHPQYRKIRDRIMENSSIIPLDPAKDEAVPYSNEEFWHICWDLMNTDRTITVMSMKDLFGCEKLHGILSSRIGKHDYEYRISHNYNMNMWNIDTIDGHGDASRLNMLDTILDVYDWLRPVYVKRYRADGRLYGTQMYYTAKL